MYDQTETPGAGASALLERHGQNEAARRRAEEEVLGRSHPALAVKRVIDIIASIALLIVLLPLWLLIALMIKVDSHGPILFRQERMGRGGRPFGMLKFRTMIKDADVQKLKLLHLNESDGLFKISSDPRVTRFGRLLRSTSFDELPQLLHVVRGEMSLVGPRPLVAEEDAKIAEPFRMRSQMRPGMTGPWQVAGASRIPMRDMVMLDCSYVEDWSLLGDLRILLLTLPHVVFRRGI